MTLSTKEIKALSRKMASRSRPTQARLTPAQRLQMVKDYLEDPKVSIAEIARRYGVSPQTAKYHLKRITDPVI